MFASESIITNKNEKITQEIIKKSRFVFVKVVKILTTQVLVMKVWPKEVMRTKKNTTLKASSVTYVLKFHIAET